MNHILRNFPHCKEYSEDSFLGIFHEQRKWDDTEYFKLEEELYEQCNIYASVDSLPRDLSWPAMRIFSVLMLSLGCHCNPSDSFKIEALTQEQIRDRTERVQLVFEGFFKGEMPNKKYLEY